MAPTAATFALGFLLLGVAVAFLIGVGLALFGWAGRQIDDHPLCRRCGFDLTARASDRCPECGNDLARRGAITVGHRRRRPVAIAAGALLVLLALATGGGVATRAEVDWQGFKPTWWLLAEARGTSARRDAAIAAIAALIRRAETGALSPERRDALADRLLTIQADLTQPWNPAWGDWLAGGVLDGTLSDERRGRFLSQSFAAGTATLTVRPDVRRGEPLPMMLRVTGVRAGTSGLAGGRPRLVVVRDSRDRVVVVDGVEPPPPRRDAGHGIGRSMLEASGGVQTWVQHPADALRPLPIGPHTVEVRQQFRITDGLGEDARQLGTVDARASATFTLHEADAELVRRVRDESLRPAMAAAITAESLERHAGDPDHASLTLRVNSPPVDVGFDVALRQGDREWPAGTLAWAAKRGSLQSGTGARTPGLRGGEPVDVVLRPSVRAAAGTTDVFAIWDHELVIPGVPVKTNER